MIKFSEIDLADEYKLYHKILVVHQYLFNNATLNTQINKFSEEYSEYCSATTNEDELKEIADMYISACGIKRFNYSVGNALCEYVLTHYVKFTKEQILLAVIEKMKLLQTRVWEEKENGVYHHVELFTDKNEDSKTKTNSSSNKK